MILKTSSRERILNVKNTLINRTMRIDGKQMYSEMIVFWIYTIYMLAGAVLFFWGAYYLLKKDHEFLSYCLDVGGFSLIVAHVFALYNRIERIIKFYKLINKRRKSRVQKK